MGFFIFTLYAAWVSRDLPDPNSLISRQIPQSTKIYDRSGTHLLYEIHGDEKRTLVPLEDIPDYIKQATVSIEDRQFYEHHGIYWRGLVRAVVFSVLRGQRIQGTSTLTQQFVKNAVLTNERSLDRKLREFILALQIERKYSKDQILQLYLNEIPYGSTIYGVEAAAQTYFDKPAKELTIDESALLASIPQRPSFYSPYSASGAAEEFKTLIGRQHYTIDRMVADEYITEEEGKNAKSVDTLAKVKPRTLGDIAAPHFVMHVREQLETTYGVKTVGEGGLYVITTLDWDKQRIAEEEVVKGVEARGERYGFGNAALVSLDPKTGHVLAMVGSKDFFDKEIDGQVNVTLSQRQPGSSFKPVVYAAAFARGYLPETQLWDVKTTFKTDTQNYQPNNYDLKERGPVSLRQALQGSLNIPAVKLLYLVGLGSIIDFAEELGYSTFGDRSRFGLSLVLGGGEVLPIEHAAAFGVFAREGEYHAPVSILKVTDAQNKTLEEWKESSPKRVLDAQTARIVNNVLSDNNARASVFGQSNSLTLPGRPVAAKTGTTNNFKDAWTAGYTPGLATVVWVGNSKGEEMRRGADGSIVAAPIWQAYMRRALEDTEVERFTAPAPSQTTKLALLGKVFEEKVNVNKITGKRATEFTPTEFVEERLNRVAHSILWYVDKNDPTGPPPSNPASDPQFGNWEAAVQTWVEKTRWNATSTVPLEYDDVFTEANRPKVTIISPSENSTLATRTVPVQALVAATRPVVRVEAYIDGVPVGSTDSAPWEFEIRIPNRVERGFRTLTVRAYDDIGLPGETSVSVNLVAEPDASFSGVNILSPQNDDIWSRASFPKKIQANLDEPSLYERVDVALLGADGIRRLVGTTLSPEDSVLEVTLPAGPPAGRHTIVVEALRRGTGTIDQANIFITVTE
ncbi:MAG: PBP1A family penicillin-binding protein [Patescibacteria group bacterium]